MEQNENQTHNNRADCRRWCGRCNVLDYIYTMRIDLTAFALAIAAWVILLAGTAVVRGGTFACNANCLSKAASIVAIAANGKAILAGGKKGVVKIAHPKRKSMKGTK